VPITFGPVVTEGAFRLQLGRGVIVVTPLPDLDSFTVEVRFDELFDGVAAQVESIIAVDSSGGKIRDVEFESRSNLVKFQTRGGEFAYRIQ
jgi:hypothetical protein